MENYIVRVYRRDMQDNHELVGLVENVENEEKLAFHSLEELCSILSVCPVAASVEPRPDTGRTGAVGAREKFS